MRLFSKPPFDHVAVMSEFPPHLSAKMSLRVCITRGSWLLSSLLCHHPRLWVVASCPWVTLVCTHGGTFTPRRLSRLLWGPSLWHTENHPLLSPCSGQLPKSIVQPGHPTISVLLLPPHDALGGGQLGVSLLLKAPFWNEGDPGPMCSGSNSKLLWFLFFYSFPEAQPSEW